MNAEQLFHVFCTGINDSTEALFSRTTYDRLFFINEVMKTITEKTGKAEVSARMLADVFIKVSAESLYKMRGLQHSHTQQ